MKSLSALTESEVLALAIANEEEDSRIYQTFAEKIRKAFPNSARVFDEMAEEERTHRSTLYDAYRSRFGEHLPPIRREDVRGFMKRRNVWMLENLGLERMRKEAEVMELQAANFYDMAAAQTQDLGVRELFVHLAEVERGHGNRAAESEDRNLTLPARQREDEASRRVFLLQYIQPGLVGLMDGSVSTLAPLFAAAFATRENWPTFLVGLAAAIGAGISMGSRGSLVRRRQDHRARFTAHPRDRLRPDDHGRRHLPHHSLSRAANSAECLRDRDHDRGRDRAHRALGDLLGPGALYGYAAARAAFQVVIGGILVFVAGILIGSA